MKNINQKITLKGITHNLKLLIKSNYEICALDPEYFGCQIKNDKYDVISLDSNIEIEKHVIGSFFTYIAINKTTGRYGGSNRHLSNPNILIILKT
jgi:hypothetical protein